MTEQLRVPCPFCKELILADALKCKECGSTLKSRTWFPNGFSWYRDLPDRKLLGVAACVARNARISVTLVRLGIVVACFFSGAGVLAYFVLAAVLPFEQGGRSLFDKIVDAASAAFESLRYKAPVPPATANGAPADGHTPLPPAPAAEADKPAGE
jgi:phage shock protein PspC (stress-responsive transcriptional regulator)